MKASLSFLLIGVVSLLSAGCRAGSPPLRVSPESPHEIVVERCSAQPADARAKCYEDTLLATLRDQGVSEALQILARLGERHEEVRRDGHVYAHAIGLAAYSGAEEVGSTFRQCSALFQSGCYHGVIQAYFVEHASEQGAGRLEAETVNALCRDYRGEGEHRWLLFQCAHGLGHGLTMLFEHDLPEALEACDLVASEWEREVCFGGAFMENIVHATAPHHGVGRPDDASEHSNSHHAENHGEHRTEAFPALDASDPLYPCSVLAERYLTACYQMQTSAILHHNGGDIAAAAETCGRVPGDYRYFCYQSLGRDISSRTLQNHAEAVRLCSAAAADYRPACHEGYVKNLVDLSARAEDGFAYCRVLAPGADKRRCYEAVGEQIWVLSDDREEQEALCGAAEPGYRDACRWGAGLREARARRPPLPQRAVSG